MGLIIIFIVLFMSCINRSLYKNWLNYVNVFLIIWGGASAISTFGFYDFYVPPIRLYMYIIVTLISFEVFSIMFLKIRFVQHGKINKDSYNKNKYQYSKFTILVIIMFIIICSQVPKGIAYIAIGGFNHLRQNSFGNTIYSPMIRIFLEYIAQPISLVAVLAGSLEMVKEKKIYIMFIIGIANCLSFMFLFANRLVLVEMLLIIIITIIRYYGVHIFKFIKGNKTIGVAIIIMGATVIEITKQRSVGNSNSIIYNIYTYFVGSIHLLGVYLSNPSIYYLDIADMLYGWGFISGIIGPVTLALRVFGIEILSGIEIINQITQEFVSVSPNVRMNNNVTMLYPFLRDFGVLGIIFGVMIVALFYAWIYKLNKKCNNTFTECLYNYSLCILPFLIIEWMYGRMSVVLVYIFIWMFIKPNVFRKSKKEIKRGKALC